MKWFEKIKESIFKAKAVIRKEGSQYCIFSKTGKKLSCHPTKKEAEDRLREIEFFKSQENKNGK